ncbi:MAG: hypothetical protein ACLFQV_07915 [Vulcanimicrobiota bacterium]
MKKSIIILLAVVLLFSVGSQVFAQEGKAGKPEIKIDETEYPPVVVKISNSIIKIGDSVEMVWGIMGPPDHIWAMRGKDNRDQDYVKMVYYSYGLNIDVTNLKNTVQGIMVEENNQVYKLVNLPFKLGQTRQDVINEWGEPEKTIQNTLAYWKRGVYITTDDEGLITHIFISSPGKFEDEK